MEQEDSGGEKMESNGGSVKALGMEVLCRTWDWEGMVRAHAQGSDWTAEKTCYVECSETSADIVGKRTSTLRSTLGWGRSQGHDKVP